MADREKVLKGLEICISPVCRTDCPYYNDRDGCSLMLMQDALELLKAQEPVPIIITDNEPFGTGVWCDCGNCGETLIVLKDTNTEAASKMIRYCRKCGRAVKWE